MKLDLLFAHFDELIATPEDVQRLNALILDLAVRGKLVAQDAGDEPAIELVRRASGASRSRDFSAKRSTSLSILPEIPAQWVWVHSSDVCSSINDGDHLPPPKSDTGVPFLVISNIRAGKLDFRSTRFVTDEYYEALREERKPRRGDILYSIVGSLGIAVLIEDDIKFCFQRHMALFRPLNAIDSKYLFYLLKAPFTLRQARSSATGIAQLTIPMSALRSLSLPLPPLAEQQRIVARVEMLFAQTRALEAKLSQAQDDLLTASRATLHRLRTAQDDGELAAAWGTLAGHFDLLTADPRSIAELRQAILDLAVRGKLVPQEPRDEPAGELVKRIAAKAESLAAKGKLRFSDKSRTESERIVPFAVPLNWTWATLDSLCYVGTGSTPRRDEPKYYEDGDVAWVNSGVTGNPYITEASEFITQIALAETNCHVYPAGTLLVALYGQGKTRGQVSELMIPAATNQACAALVFDDMDGGIRPFVKIFLQRNYQHLRSLAEGGAQPNLNVGKVKSMFVPLPPLAEQQRIVAKVDQLMALCDALEAQLAQAAAVRGQFSATVLAGAGG